MTICVIAKYYFVGVANSFDRAEQLQFHQKYYQLLLHREFPVKVPKLTCVGAADSAKTALFGPFEGNFLLYPVCTETI